MKTIYLVADGIAIGSHEIEPDADLLGEIKRHVPNAREIVGDPKGQVVTIHTTNYESTMTDRENVREFERGRPR